MENQNVIKDIIVSGKSYHASPCKSVCDGCAFDRRDSCGVGGLIDDNKIPSCIQIKNGVADIIWIENSPNK